MLGPYARAAMLAFALWAALAGTTKADDLAAFNAAIEEAAAHNRVAVGYLRTGNVDLAALEIDRLRTAWRQVVARFSGKRPAEFKDTTLYGTTLTTVSARLVAADLMLNSGRPAAARQSLTAMREDLHALRKSAGVAVLADCILDSNKAAAVFLAYDKRDLDWNKPQIRDDIAAAAAAYGKALDRCDAMASEGLRQQPEFRRLIDSAKDEIGRVPNAIETRDAGLLHRIVIALRAIDNLLAFRFG